MSSDTALAKLIRLFKAVPDSDIEDMADTLEIAKADLTKDEPFRAGAHKNPDVQPGPSIGMSGFGAEEMAALYSNSVQRAGSMAGLYEALARDFSAVRDALARHETALSAIADQIAAKAENAEEDDENDEDEAAKARKARTLAKRVALLEKAAADGHLILETNMRDVIDRISGRSRHPGGPPDFAKAHPEGGGSWAARVEEAIDAGTISSTADVISAHGIAAALDGGQVAAAKTKLCACGPAVRQLFP